MAGFVGDGSEGSMELALIEDEVVERRKVDMGRIEEHGDWALLSRIPMLLSAGVPVPKFRVRDLLGLRAGQMVESGAAITDDVPVKIGTVALGWIEFEVVEQRMAVRLTRLA